MLTRRCGAGRRAREEAPGNLCQGSKARGEGQRVFAGPASRKEEVKPCCRTLLQSRAEALPEAHRPDSKHTRNVQPTLALVWTQSGHAAQAAASGMAGGLPPQSPPQLRRDCPGTDGSCIDN